MSYLTCYSWFIKENDMPVGFKKTEMRKNAESVLNEFVFTRTFRTLDCSVQQAILEFCSIKKLIECRELTAYLSEEV